MLTSFSPSHIVFNFNLAHSISYLLTHFDLASSFTLLSVIYTHCFCRLPVEHTVCRLKAVHAILCLFSTSIYNCLLLSVTGRTRRCCRLPVEHTVLNRSYPINTQSIILTVIRCGHTCHTFELDILFHLSFLTQSLIVYTFYFFDRLHSVDHHRSSSLIVLDYSWYACCCRLATGRTRPSIVYTLLRLVSCLISY